MASDYRLQFGKWLLLFMCFAVADAFYIPGESTMMWWALDLS